MDNLSISYIIKNIEKRDKLLEEVINNSIVLENDNLTTEEVLNVISDIIYYIDKALQASMKVVIDFLSTTTIAIDETVKYSTKTPGIKLLSSAATKFYKFKVDNQPLFTQVKRLKTPILPGLVVTYRELFNIIEELKDLLLYKTVYELKELQDNIRDIMDGIVQLSDINDKLKDKNMKLKKIVEETNILLSKVTDTRVLIDRKEIGKLTSGYNDLYQLSELLLKDGISFRMEKLEESQEILNSLIKTLRLYTESFRDKKIVGKKEYVKNLAMYVENVAKLVTNYGFMFYLYYQLVDMLVACEKVIETKQESYPIIDKIAYTISSVSENILSSYRKLIK